MASSKGHNGKLPKVFPAILRSQMLSEGPNLEILAAEVIHLQGLQARVMFKWHYHEGIPWYLSKV
jgi:hypothetical protein